MGKRKYIVIAIVIVVLGLGYGLYLAGRDKITDRLPEEQMLKMSTEEDYTEAHYFIPD